MTCPWSCAVCSLCSLTYTRALSPTVAFTPPKVTLAQLPQGCYNKAHKKKNQCLIISLFPSGQIHYPGRQFHPKLPLQFHLLSCCLTPEYYLLVSHGPHLFLCIFLTCHCSHLEFYSSISSFRSLP